MLQRSLLWPSQTIEVRPRPNAPRPASLSAATVWPLSDLAPSSRPPPSEEARAPLPVSMVKAPPQPRSRPPPDPLPCKLSVPLESLTPSEPPEPPDPPDARQVLFSVVCLLDSNIFNLCPLSHDVAVSSSPSFRLVKTGSEPCYVFKNQLLRVFTGCFPLFDISLLYIGRSKPSTSISQIFWLCMETNDFELRVVFSRSVWLQSDHGCGSFLDLISAFTSQRINFELSSATSGLQGTWSLMFSLIKNDEKRLGLVFIDLWNRYGNIGGWSPCWNSTTAYPSDIIKLIPQGTKVKVSLFSTKPRTVKKSLIFMELTSFAHSNECSRSEVQGTVLSDQDTLVELPSSPSHQDIIHSSSTSSLSRMYATVLLPFLLNNMISGTVEIHLVSRIIIVSIKVVLAHLMDCIARYIFSMSIAKALIFTGQSGTSNTRGSTMQESLSSLWVVEALALRSALLTAVNLELQTLKMLTDISTLVSAINNDNQNKEIYGIVKDIHQLSSDFVDISFLRFSRRCNGDVNRLAITTLGNSHVLDPVQAEL